MNRTLRITASSFLIPLFSILAASGCSESVTPGGTGGLVGETGGAGPGAGGTFTGGTNGSTGGTTASGGAIVGTGGAVATGGTNAGTGGTAATGGTSAGGAAATGGTDAGTGGGDAGTGGESNGTPTFHIFMLMGQSNMAGVAPRQASDANTDERMKVFGGCGHPAGQWSTVTNPPLDECPGESGINLNNSVDPGIWFAKTLLEKLPPGDTIGLVGTAESGESINTFIAGGSHHNMILTKIAGAKTAPNARFAGIIFHQGESDTGQSTWPGKVVQLYNEVKTAWGVDYDVPMILGELPAGGCCSSHNTRVHEAAAQLPMGSYVTQDGTKVMDQYHFDHASVILMGTRYGEKMIEELGW